MRRGHALRTVSGNSFLTSFPERRRDNAAKYHDRELGLSAYNCLVPMTSIFSKRGAAKRRETIRFSVSQIFCDPQLEEDFA